MNCLFIYNPKSGKSRLSKKENCIVQKLKTKFDIVDVIKTHCSGDANKIASENCGKYDVFVVGGGDGTLNEVINAIAQKPNAPKIGYLPAGTTNDVAHSLHIPTNIKKAIKTILNGKVFCHDIFKTNNKYGIYVCATGLGTEASYETAQRAKNIFGKIAYFFNGARKIFKSNPINVCIKYDNVQLKKTCALMLILNSRRVAGFTVNKKACLDDGYVDVVLVDSPRKKRFSLLSLLWTAKLFLFGINYCKKKKHITYLKLKNFLAEIESAAKVNLDGENGLCGSFDFEVIKDGLEIFVPWAKMRLWIELNTYCFLLQLRLHLNV